MSDTDKELDNIGEELSQEELLDDTLTEDQQEESEDANVTDWEQKYNELNNSYLRLNAEFDNYRKRTLKEKADMLKSGSERVLIDIITVADDLERALANVSNSNDIEALKEGVDLIYTKFQNFLTKHNVKEIEAIGQPFDTDRHEALTTIPAESEDKKDKILDCIQKGYTLDDKVIRYSKVIVAK